MKTRALKLVSIAALAVMPLMASAQLSSNISLTSNYKFRGQDQDQLRNLAAKPALQGGFDYAFSNGFYLGNWNSSVNWLENNSIEMDFYGGHKGELAQGLSYDVGALKYMFPGASQGNTTEVYVGLGYGPFTAKYSQSVSKDYFFYGSKASYMNLAYSTEIATGLSLKAAVGYTNFKSNATYPDFTDYSVGLTYDLGNGYSVTGAAVGATKASSFMLTNGVNVNKDRFILTFTKAM